MRPRVSSRFLEGLLYALTAFGLFAFGCVEPWSRAALEILSFLLALACFLRGRPAVPPAADWAWLFPAAFAALGYLQLQTPAAPDGPRPWTPFTAAPHATGAAVLLWASYAAILWSVPRVIRTHQAARRYVRALFGLGLALATLGLLQAATGGDKLYWLRDASGANPFGPYYNRDHAANVLLMSMTVGIGLFFSRLKRGPDIDDASLGRTRGLVAGGVSLLFGGIVFCGSRGAILSMPLAAAALGLFGAGFAKNAKGRRVRAAIALAGAAVVIFVTFQYVVAAADAGALIDKSIMGRLSIYGDAARWWRDTPFFGSGLGSFETIYPAYQDLELRATVAHAHSDWLEILLEAGLAGSLTALAAAVLTAFAAVRAWRAARSAEMRALIGGALAAVAAFSVHALFEFCFQIPGNAVMFLGLVGFLLSAPAWADKASAGERPKPPSALPALLAAACLLFLAQAAARPAAAEWLAGTPGDAGERAAGVARAYSMDGDPAYLKRLAWIRLEKGGASDASGLGAQRAALRYALAAAEASRFDSDVLSLAATSLWRLGRPADAGALSGEAAKVRFTPLTRAGFDATADAEAARRRLETLRSISRRPGEGR